MTVEIGILFAILTGMAYLFFTEKLPVDLTAFIGLVVLILGRYLTTDEAFIGFSSPAVITMFSVFFISAGLLHTGVADMVGTRVHRLIGNRETPLLIAIMLVAGVLSAFMNNIAAAAVLLPAVASIAKKTGISPSRLFMPLSFGAILGGTTTLVGTPPNILAAGLLRDRGLEPFSLFDFTPLGLVLLGVGTLYMATIGKRLLPTRNISDAAAQQGDLVRAYQLSDTLFSIRIPASSRLAGVTLQEAQLGTALGVQVVSIIRGGRKQLAPEAGAVIDGGDVLLVKGKFEDVQELFRIQGLEIGDAKPGDLATAMGSVSAIAACIRKGSSCVGRTLRSLRFRKHFGVIVVGIRRGGVPVDRALGAEVLAEGDEIVAMGSYQKLEGMMAMHDDFEITTTGSSVFDQIEGRISVLRVPEQSALAGATLAESRMGELVGLTVIGISRGEETILAASPDEKIRPGDRLLVAGEEGRIRGLLDMGEVQIEQDAGQDDIESDDVGIVEAIVAPRSQAAGRTLAEMNFREKHGLQALALWREGSPLHTRLGSRVLRFGDALLLQGPWNKIQILGADRDFVVLSPQAQEPRRTKKAPFALGALGLMIACVMTGFLPIHAAAFMAGVVVVLSGAITMEEAYRAVEWRAVFLVAAVLPVGIAMERTGAALLMAGAVTSVAGPLGPYAVLAGLFVLSSVLSQALDGAPAVVLLTPVALLTAEQLGMSPYTIMMGISLAASAAFMTPFSHKANLLVMGAGGYKVTDYLKVGTPLTIVLIALLVLLTPIFFPIH